MIYFTSDTHFGHANIIKYCSRPFSSVEEMDSTIINNWNSVVLPKDTVFHLGDFSFHPPEKNLEILLSLNGSKILIAGNHDKNFSKSSAMKGLTFKAPYYELMFKDPSKKSGKNKIVMSHFPMEEWTDCSRGSYMLHGHCHGNLKRSEYRRLDVGVDPNNFKLLSLDEVMRVLSVKPYKSHHGAIDSSRAYPVV